MISISVVLPGSPRTKKTSNRVVWGTGKRPIVLPSEAYVEWSESLMRQRWKIRGGIVEPALPILDPVAVKALIYRDRDVGDLAGYEQAIGDMIQEPQYLCASCRKRVYEFSRDDAPCCARPLLKASRPGLGLILDDVLIKSWDGTRMLVDSKNPRVEVTITVHPKGTLF